MSEYVYLMRQEDRSKIGVSNDPDKRAKTISYNSGLNTEVVYQIEVEGRKQAFEFESFLHVFFDDIRLVGEFFKKICIESFKSAAIAFDNRREEIEKQEEAYIYYWTPMGIDGPIKKIIKAEATELELFWGEDTEQKMESSAIEFLTELAEQCKNRADKFTSD